MQTKKNDPAIIPSNATPKTCGHTFYKKHQCTWYQETGISHTTRYQVPLENCTTGALGMYHHGYFARHFPAGLSLRLWCRCAVVVVCNVFLYIVFLCNCYHHTIITRIVCRLVLWLYRFSIHESYYSLHGVYPVRLLLYSSIRKFDRFSGLAFS